MGKCDQENICKGQILWSNKGDVYGKCCPVEAAKATLNLAIALKVFL
jgi:hypothetical protein